MEKHLFDDLARDLPPIIRRVEVDNLLNGIISSKRLANLDSLNEGPPRYRVGRRIVYKTKDLLNWLTQRSERLK